MSSSNESLKWSGTLSDQHALGAIFEELGACAPLFASNESAGELVSEFVRLLTAAGSTRKVACQCCGNTRATTPGSLEIFSVGSFMLCSVCVDERKKIE